MDDFDKRQTTAHLDPDLIDGGDPKRRRFFDTRLNAMVVSVCQGDYYVSARPNEVLSTLLGSCVAVCMRDPKIGCGGMNHFVLPAQTATGGHLPNRNLPSPNLPSPNLPSPNLPSTVLRYGSYSIERLTNELIARGAKRTRLEIKVFGGANILLGPRNFGHANADFVERYFAREGLEIAAKDLRGTMARRLRYYPVIGKAFVSYGPSAPGRTIAEREAEIVRQVNFDRDGPSIELFDN
ncbi:MAG: chemoreceptor glutamine deamidase CheD [Hyphomicrobium aestuarii]|nr:chemoreceptor glutamine deamidase CheD [Hyphomicrobium aestuarii]